MRKTIVAIALVGMAWACAGPQQQTPVEVQRLTPEEFIGERMSRKVVLLDVRTPEEFAGGHLDGAQNSDFRGGAFAEEMASWDKDKKFYLYCASGNRSSKAAEMMRQAGFKHIYDIGAYPALKEAGVPTKESTVKP